MSLALSYACLGVAIVAEVFGTTALKLSDGFTRPVPSMLTLAGYAVSFYLLSLSLRTISTGVAYAIWSGVGIVLINAVSWVWFKQTLDLPAFIGIGLIMAGVLVLNLFSGSVTQ